MTWGRVQFTKLPLVSFLGGKKNKITQTGNREELLPAAVAPSGERLPGVDLGCPAQAPPSGPEVLPPGDSQPRSAQAIPSLWGQLPPQAGPTPGCRGLGLLPGSGLL